MKKMKINEGCPKTSFKSSLKYSFKLPDIIIEALSLFKGYFIWVLKDKACKTLKME